MSYNTFDIHKKHSFSILTVLGMEYIEDSTNPLMHLYYNIKEDLIAWDNANTEHNNIHMYDLNCDIVSRDKKFYDDNQGLVNRIIENLYKLKLICDFKPALKSDGVINDALRQKFLSVKSEEDLAAINPNIILRVFVELLVELPIFSSKTLYNSEILKLYKISSYVSSYNTHDNCLSVINEPKFPITMRNSEWDRKFLKTF